MLRPLTLLAVGGLLAACPSSSTPVAPDEGPPPATVAPAQDTAVSAAPDTAPAAPTAAADPGAAKTAAAANNAFGLALYEQVRVGEGNRFFSPISLSTALAMTSLGAAGDTEKELRAALRLPDAGAHEAFAALQAGLEKDRGDDATLTVANRLWGHQGYEFLDSFVTATKAHYGAGLERVDFAATEAARQTINRWISEKTAEKIPELLPEGLLTDQVRLVLTNAVYFKGDWELAFDAGDTRPAPFAVSADKTVEAQLMFRKARFEYAEDERVQVIAMPYQGADLSMVVVLPKAKDGLAAVEATLAEDLPKWMDQLGAREIATYFPRFEMRAKAQMNDALKALGVEQAFSMSADFSPMSGKKDLYLSAVVHEAYVKVDEKGTEAAAATAAIVAVKGISVPTVFRADHPFFFAIRDERSGALLFVGRVVDPTAG